MSSKDHRMRLASVEPAKSDGNSSIQVVGASSNRAQSTTPQSRAQSPDPSSLASPRLHASSQTLSLRNRSSMEDDLRGLDSRSGPHGVKRRRAELSDDEESDGEPGPKRDRLLEELCDLQSIDRANDTSDGTKETEHDKTAFLQPYHGRPLEDQDLPLRLHRQVEGVPDTEVRNRQTHQNSTPKASVGGSGVYATYGVSKRQRTPPARP